MIFLALLFVSLSLAQSSMDDLFPFPSLISNAHFKYTGFALQGQSKSNQTINGTVEYFADVNGSVFRDISYLTGPLNTTTLTTDKYWTFNKSGILFFSVINNKCQYFKINPKCTPWQSIDLTGTNANTSTNNANNKYIKNLVKPLNPNISTAYFHNCSIKMPFVSLNQSQASTSMVTKLPLVNITVTSIVELDNKNKLVGTDMLVYSNDTLVASFRVSVVGFLNPTTATSIVFPVNQPNCNVNISNPASSSSKPNPNSLLSIISAIVGGPLTQQNNQTNKSQ